MVFVDISGFTKMSERLARHGKVGAEEVTDVIDNTFGRLLPSAYSFGATLLKFGGDAMLMLFTGAGHAARACAGAMAMRQELREIGTFETNAGQVTLRMSVGVHSGLFDFFMVGESHRELIVSGPAATATVAMESAATAGQILISHATAAALPRRNVGRPVGPGLLLRGQVGADVLGFVPAPSVGVDLTNLVPSALRNVLLAGNVEPEHRPAAVAFIHFSGFDELLARDGAERATENLDHLITTIQTAADHYEITFLASDIASNGGKIILTAGVPVASGNDEEQMLLALRQIVSKADVLPVSIGVNWGPVFAGEVGLPFRQTYTVMGDTVNLAARLMAKAPHGEIYATAALLEGSRTTFDYTTPEPFFVKGKKLPIQAFSIGEPAGSKSGLGAGAMPLIGRESELAVMLEAWERARAGEGRVVEIAAEPGIGKSRLLEEFLVSAHPSTLIRAECRLYQSTTPYFPFRTLLRAAWGLSQLDADNTEAALIQLVRSSAPTLEPWLALIGIPLGLSLAESSEVAELEDQSRPARTMAAVSALLEATVTESTLFVIEDTHWMDEASSELLGGLLSSVPNRPWLIALTRRPGDEGFALSGTGRWVRINLQPLGIEHAREFIISATTDAPLLPQQIELLASRAAGHPLFLIELLDAFRRGGDVDSLPHSVEGMIGARIDKLPVADRSLLRRLAVLGSGFSGDHVSSVLRDHERQPGGMVRGLRRLNDFLVRNQSDWIQFRHALIRDVAYEGLPFKTRLDLHARIGDAICGSSQGQPESQAELLSLHYFYAQHWEDAWHFSCIAGDRAREIYANAEAITFYQRALEAGRHLPLVLPHDRAPVLTHLGDVLTLAGRFDMSLAAYRRATTLVKDDHLASAELYLRGARQLLNTGRYRAAVATVTRGLKHTEGNSHPQAVQLASRLTALLATIRLDQLGPKRALPYARRALDRAIEAADHEALAQVNLVLSRTHLALGHTDEALSFAQEALSRFQELGHMRQVGNMMNNLGVQAAFDDKWDEALDWFRKSEEAFRRIGAEADVAAIGVNIGDLLTSQRRHHQAESILAEAARVLNAAHFGSDALNADIQLARVRSETDPARGVAELERLRAIAVDTGEAGLALEAGLHLSRALTGSGRGAEASALLESLESSATEEFALYGATVPLLRAEAFMCQELLEPAAEQIELGLSRAAEGSAYDKARLLETKSQIISRAGGTPDPADLAEVASIFSRLGVSPSS